MGALRNFKIAASNVSVRDAEFRDHFTDDVVEIGAMSNVINKRAILVAQRVPIIAVHILDVEEIAVTSHNFVEDFDPLLLWNAVHHEAVGGNILRAGFAFGLEVVKFESAPVAHQDFLAVLGNVEAV